MEFKLARVKERRQFTTIFCNDVCEMSFKLPLRGLYLFSVKKVSTEFALHEHNSSNCEIYILLLCYSSFDIINVGEVLLMAV